MRRLLVASLIVFLFLASGCAHTSNVVMRDAEQGRHLFAIETSLIPSDSAEAPRQSVEERLRHWHVPAVSVAVFGDGQMLWAKAWGVTDAATQRPVDVRTRFQAGSISKPVTATAVLQMADEHRLERDGDVTRALRSWVLPSHSWSPSDTVTPARLISHSAGTSVRSFPGYSADVVPPTVYQVLDGLPPANTPPIRVVARPGEAYSYSGGGYVILQVVLMDLERATFESLMQRRLLGRLRMTRSTFAILGRNQDADIATGHDALGVPVDGGWHNYPESAAAGLWATPSDLARFAMGMQAALNAPGAGRSIVSQESARWMISPNRSPEQGMAFDLSPTSFYHAGDTEGYYAGLVAGKDGHTGIAIMTNGAQGGHLINEILGAVANEYRWEF